MTKDELKAHIQTIATLGDILKPWIPGDVDDRVIEYIRALGNSDELLELIAEDITPQVMAATADGPEGDVVFLAANGDEVARISPEIWILIITELLPILLEWIRNRRGGGGGIFNRGGNP